MATKQKKTRTKSVPANESKAEKFKRLANQRAANALKHINNLGKLGTKAYERTPEQTAKLASVLHDAVDAAIAKLATAETAVKNAITTIL